MKTENAEMKFNASCDVGHTQVQTSEVVWKYIAERLWSLLDDVDTAGDMFKPPINNFFKYVIGKAEKRHKYLHSDGYSLVLTKELLDSVSSEMSNDREQPITQETVNCLTHEGAKEL